MVIVKKLNEERQPSIIKVGDKITYDGNPLGVTPRPGSGTVLAISRSMAGHGNPGTYHYLVKIKVSSKNGIREVDFYVPEYAVETVNGKPYTDFTSY
jgi:hypothetical protein